MLKRAFDFLFALVALLFFFPVIVVLMVTVRLMLGSPVFFTQIRPGLGEKLFMMYKFRTMRDAVDAHGEPLPDHARLTKFGRFLRASSLDELPQLMNVLKGDISLVGCRPLLVEYLPLYSARQRRRHDVKPGITGWAQINGRNAIGWDQKFELDIWYVENRSFLLDLKILLLTFISVLARKNVEPSNAPVMERFRGNSENS